MRANDNKQYIEAYKAACQHAYDTFVDAGFPPAEVTTLHQRFEMGANGQRTFEGQYRHSSGRLTLTLRMSHTERFTERSVKRNGKTVFRDGQGS